MKYEKDKQIAVIYARYSSDNQREESIDAQIRACKYFAQRESIEIVGTYVDRAKSGTSTKGRSAFLQMIEDSGRNKFDIVLVHKLNRFGRDGLDTLKYKSHLERNGVSLVSVTEKLDNSPEGRLMLMVIAGINEFYSASLKGEVMKGMIENAEKCKHTGGKPPLGYDVDPVTKRLVLNEAEAEIIKYIFKQAYDGVGYNRIVEELNQRGHKTKVGSKFSKNSIHTILTNEKYCGTYVFNKTSSAVNGKRNSHNYKDDSEIIRKENAVPQIIDKEMFNEMQEKMSKRKKEFVGHKVIETYLLTGKIICGNCGSKYCGCRRRGGRSKDITVRYECNKRQRQGKSSGCNNKNIRREYIEALVLDELAQNIFDDRLLPLIYNQFKEHNDTANSEKNMLIQTLQGQIKTVEKDIAAVMTLLMEKALMTFIEKLEALENEKAELTQKLYEAETSKKDSMMSYSEVTALFNEAREMFKDGTLESLAYLIELFVEFVVIHENSVEIKFSFNKNNDRYDYDSNDNKHYPASEYMKEKPVSSGLSDTVSKNTYWRGGGGGN